MDSPPSRSLSSDDGLRLPRAPGVIRRFWARHPHVTDLLVALLTFLSSIAGPSTLYMGGSTPQPEGIAHLVPLVSLIASGMTLLGCVFLLWRRTLPFLPFVAAGAAHTAYLLAPYPISGTLLLVASYSLAVYRSSRDAWMGFGAMMGWLCAVGGVLLVTETSTFPPVVNSILLAALTGLLGTLIGINVGNRKRYLEAVLDRSRQLLIERDQQEQLATGRERERIAREMHDIVSHSLTVVVALSEGAAATADIAKARQASLAASETARNALKEMRAMLGILREGDGAAPLAPLAATAPSVSVDAARRAGFAATLTVTGNQQLSGPVAFAVGRVVQEGLTNAMRHAPEATAIDVRISYGTDDVEVTVRNDGVQSFVPLDAGFGILGLTERVVAVGGSLSSARASDHEWLLAARIPREHRQEGEYVDQSIDR